MKYISLVAIGLFISCIALGQTEHIKSLQYDTTKYFGRVVLPDNTVLTGDLVFNDNDGIVTISNGSDQRSFNARSIMSFDYFDRSIGGKRLFYALEFNDPEVGMLSVDFFEVLKEFESFAVLVRIHRLKAATVKDARTNQQSTTTFQSKTIYFVDNEGNFLPYSRLTVKEYPDALFARTSLDSDMLNADLVEKYTGPHYAHLKKFAKERHLKFTRQDDLVTILYEYEAALEGEGME